MTDALVLLVAVPLVGSALTVLSGLVTERSKWPIAAVACLLELGLAGRVVVDVFTRGRQTYAVGGFAPPAGIELVADGLSASVVFAVAAISLAVLAYLRSGGPGGAPFYAGYLLLVAGLAGVTVTGDLFNMYVFLEISGLAAYALVASARTGRASVASLKYLMLGTIGASLFLLGIGYAFLATGTLNMVDLAARFGEVGYGSTLVVTAFGLIVAGLAVKVALFPLHTWQPDAYQFAPDGVSTYISALVSTVAAYALVRVIYTVFTVEFLAVVPPARDLLVYAGAASIVAGSALAVTQSDVKRMLAYSSVAQFGMIVAAAAVVEETALVGAIVHLLGHAVIKGGLFATAGVVAVRTGARTIDEYAGLGREAPIAAGAFTVLGLSLVGVPPSVGFVGKWYIAVGAVEAGEWIVAGVVLLSTLLTLAYVARIVERMYFATATAEVPAGAGRPASDGGTSEGSVDAGRETSRAVPPGMLAVVLLAAGAAVALGPAVPTFEQVLEPTVAALLNP